MSEQNVVEVKLTEDQRILFAAALCAAHRSGAKHKGTIFMVVTDSYVPDQQCSVLRLQVGLVDWKAAEKIAKIIAANAIPIEMETHFA